MEIKLLAGVALVWVVIFVDPVVVYAAFGGDYGYGERVLRTRLL